MGSFPFPSQTSAALSGTPRLLPTHAAITAAQMPQCCANYTQRHLKEGWRANKCEMFCGANSPPLMQLELIFIAASERAVISGMKYCSNFFLKSIKGAPAGIDLTLSNPKEGCKGAKSIPVTAVMDHNNVQEDGAPPAPSGLHRSQVFRLFILSNLHICHHNFLLKRFSMNRCCLNTC